MSVKVLKPLSLVLGIIAIISCFILAVDMNISRLHNTKVPLWMVVCAFVFTILIVLLNLYATTKYPTTSQQLFPIKNGVNTYALISTYTLRSILCLILFIFLKSLFSIPIMIAIMNWLIIIFQSLMFGTYIADIINFIHEVLSIKQ